MSEPNVALGTKIFNRVDKLEQLLDSIPPLISKVYIADDGESTRAKEDLYSRNYSFDLELIDLEYDAGLGRGRREIVHRLNEEFLFIVDPDHTVPNNVEILLSQIIELPDFGGIGGAIVEPEQDRFYLEAQDFIEKRDSLIRSANHFDKHIDMVAGNPLIAFNFIPNAAIFRSGCLDDYCWDSEYIIENEHVDFYVGHWKKTDWKFGVCPSVVFAHYPGGDASYMENRFSSTKREVSENYFLEKWGYSEDRVVDWVWFEGGRVLRPPFTYFQDAHEIYRSKGAGELMREAVSFISRKYW